VTGPFRVLPDDRVASLLVARSRHGLRARGARPSRYFPITRTRRRDSPDAPLLGFSLLTVYPEDPAHGLSTACSSLGVLPPTALMGSESSRLGPVARLELPRLSLGVPPTVPPAGYGAAHRFSQPLSGLSLSPPSHHFQMGGAPGVLPFRGFILPRSPASSSLTACLLGVAPVGCAAPVLGWERPRARGPVNLGYPVPRLSSPTRPSSSRKSVSSPGHV